jgi:hypothetical protein
MGELDGPAKDYLTKLAVELSARGVKCELVTTGWVPRLRLETPGHWVSGRHIDPAFEDHVMAAGFGDGQWRFWWPWIEPIAPVDDLGGAVKHILCNTLELFTEDADAGTLAEPGLSAQAMNGDCRGGECDSCEHLRGLARELQARGLHVRILSYGGSPAPGREWIEDIEVTNPATPRNGAMRVGHDGGVIWEHRRNLDSHHDTRAIAFTITAMLGVPLRLDQLPGARAAGGADE